MAALRIGRLGGIAEGITLNPNDPDYYLDLAAQEQEQLNRQLLYSGFHESTPEELARDAFVSRVQSMDDSGREGIAAYAEPPATSLVMPSGPSFALAALTKEQKAALVDKQKRHAVMRGVVGAAAGAIVYRKDRPAGAIVGLIIAVVGGVFLAPRS